MSQTPTYVKIIADIRKHNFVEVPFGVPKAGLDEAAGHFIDFLVLPQDVKDAFTVLAIPHDRHTHAGYARKERAKGGSDNKEYFNYRQVTERLLARPIQKYASEPKVTKFLKSARTVFTQAKTVLKNVIRTIDGHHPGIYRKVFSPAADHLLTMRFVKYDPAGQGEFLAKAHYDSGSCALALAESAPGLRAGRDAEYLQEVVRHGNTAIFMPALTFPNDLGSDEFPPTWHDVVQKDNTQYSKNVARWAMILFADVKGNAIPSYEETHIIERLC